MIIPVTLLVILTVVSFVIIYFMNDSSTSNLIPGDNWSCGNQGCKPNPHGEHGSEESCERVCRSFVNEGSGCTQVGGVPWNSFSDLSACRRYTE